jgi:hypothetical protein
VSGSWYETNRIILERAKEAARDHVNKTGHGSSVVYYDGLHRGYEQYVAACLTEGCKAWVPEHHRGPVVAMVVSTGPSWLKRTFGYGGTLHRRGITRRRAKGIWR